MLRRVTRGDRSPLGASVTVAQLEHDPHPLLARLREREPVSWIQALDGWLVTRHDLVLEAMRSPATFTVDDPRFSTAQVIGPSMLSLDGAEHERHRAPFVAPFRAVAVRDGSRMRRGARRAGCSMSSSRGERASYGARSRARSRPRSWRGRSGLARGEVPSMLAWYDAIVATVTRDHGRAARPAARAGEAFAALRERLEAVIGHGGRTSLLAAAAAGRR